tara:strand:- start:44 stop:247 length:204 start_codon:yes stop_codon:yes gene_type:complete
MSVVSQFVKNAQQQPVLLAMSGISGEEWEALKLYVNSSYLVDQQLVDAAQTKVIEFDTWMKENWSNV